MQHLVYADSKLRTNAADCIRSYTITALSLVDFWGLFTTSQHKHKNCTRTGLNRDSSSRTTQPQWNTHSFNGPLSGTTGVSRHQKCETNLDFTEARDSEWQWHQLGHMQVCTSLTTDNHASNPPLSFLQAGWPSCCPTNSVNALKAMEYMYTENSPSTNRPSFAAANQSEVQSRVTSNGSCNWVDLFTSGQFMDGERVGWWSRSRRKKFPEFSMLFQSHKPTIL